MPLTAPGSISNSSSKPFSNLFGRIALDNYNILEGSVSSYDYYAKVKKQPHMPCNRYPNLKPKSISQIIISTGMTK